MSAEEGGADERWVLSYADLVTLLLGFFIILYASAEMSAEKFQEISVAFAEAFNVEVKDGVAGSSALFDGGTGIVAGGNITGAVSTLDLDLEAIRQAVRERSVERGVTLNQIVVTRDVDNNVVIRLADNLLFPSASANIREDALPLLDVVVDVIHDLGNEVRVEGHTDTVPVGTDRYPTNWELSSARATAVLRYLVEQGDVHPRRLFAAGYGEFRPVASNRTPEGRALNRRADIVVLTPADEAAPDQPVARPGTE
jgi:chemotaxis protein MotB